MERLTNKELLELCEQNDWFTNGNEKQRRKLCLLNKGSVSNERLALAIWLCSENCSEKEILYLLDKKCGVQPIEDLKLCTRTENALKRCNIYTVKDLISHTETQIASIRVIGERSLEEIKEKLKEHELSFSERNTVYDDIPH